MNCHDLRCWIPFVEVFSMKPISLCCLMALLSACGEPEQETTSSDSLIEVPVIPVAPANPYEDAIAFSGATLWDGTGGGMLENAVIVVRDGRITEIFTGAAPAGADIVDLSGTWVVPGFIDAHVHVSGFWAADEVQGIEERIRSELALYARYGVTTVNSLGGEPAEAMAIRDAQYVPSLKHARVYVAGPIIADTDPLAAAKSTTINIMAGVDWIKIRVDDNLGTVQKMPWAAVEAVFDAANARGARVATHVFYLDDASRLLDLGSDLIAHSIRDRPMDDSFVAKLLDSGVCYVPTLTREVSTFAYATRPDFFDDPFFLKAAKQGEIDRLSDPQFMAEMAASPAAAAYRKALVQAQENLRIAEGSGVPVAFGTDAGPPGRFPGYFEHIEFYLMKEAGLTPLEILTSATATAAKCLSLADVGTLQPGKWADFVVLQENPLADIRATRSIRNVYVAGNRVSD
jgi:imidazolonepropionase-like amidohydrolase